MEGAVGHLEGTVFGRRRLGKDLVAISVGVLRDSGEVLGVVVVGGPGRIGMGVWRILGGSMGQTKVINKLSANGAGSPFGESS